MTEHLLPWAAFTLFIVAMLALDLGVLQRRPYVIGTKEALSWFAGWTGLALLFNIGVLLFHERRSEAAIEFFTGFLVEKSLSIDNIFVFILIFRYFRVPSPYQHKVLFWGILGAIVLRMTFIVGGLALLARFQWTLYLFGGFLLATGLAMIFRKDADPDPSTNWILRLFRRCFPVTGKFEGNRFFSKRDGKWAATPLFITVLAIESSDIVFAADSIPAIFAITPDPFIVYTSNIFAMLGLRSLYFAVSGFMKMFHFLHFGFASIIILLGLKMLLTDWIAIPVGIPLGAIVVILLICIIISLLRPRQDDLKLLFERTERLGLIPFRRLLLIENILDLAELKVRDAMRHRSGVKSLRLDLPWAQNLQMISDTHFSRFPLLPAEEAKPSGLIHIKNIPFGLPPEAMTSERLRAISRPCLEMRDDYPLEEALARFQRRYEQMAMVVDESQEWIGIITIEDVMEEIVGKIGDEFDLARAAERYVSLADAMTPARVILGLQADSMPEAIRSIISRVPSQELPAPPETILRAVMEREQALSTYLGRGLAIPHGRLDSLEKPLLTFARSDEGVPVGEGVERADLLFLLLTPGTMPRLQPRLLADIVGLVESEYVTERLRTSVAPLEVIEVIRAGQQVVLD